MKLYGIFDYNNNYQLLRYSDCEQIDRTYSMRNSETKTFYEVKEVCIPNIDYSESYIGQYYNVLTDSFSEVP